MYATKRIAVDIAASPELGSVGAALVTPSWDRVDLVERAEETIHYVVQRELAGFSDGYRWFRRQRRTRRRARPVRT